MFAAFLLHKIYELPSYHSVFVLNINITLKK